MGSWEPITPASRDKQELGAEETQFLQESEAALNSKEGFEEGALNSSVPTVVLSSDHEEIRPGCPNAGASSVEGSSRNSNFAAETYETVDIGGFMKQLPSGSESKNCSGSSSTINADSQGGDSGIPENGLETDTENGLENSFGSEKTDKGKKRKGDFGLDRKQKPKKRRHRPKVFDETKPKKTKIQKKEKTEKPKKTKIEKEKKEKTDKPKSGKGKKRTKKQKIEKEPANIIDPHTPEPSAPLRTCVFSTSSEEQDGQEFDVVSNPIGTGHVMPSPMPSCRRVLVYDLDGQGEHSEDRENNSSSDKLMNFDFNVEGEDFDFCTEMRKMVWEEKYIKDFPLRFKRKRTGRRRSSTYPYFWEALKVLPTVQQFSAALMDPKSFNCMLALAMQSKTISRKRRSKLVTESKEFKRLGVGPRKGKVGKVGRRKVSEVGWRLKKQRKAVNFAFPYHFPCPKRKRSHHKRIRRNVLEFVSNISETRKKSHIDLDLNYYPKDEGLEDQFCMRKNAFEYVEVMPYFPTLQLVTRDISVGNLSNLYVEDSRNMMTMMSMMGDTRNMMAMMNMMDMNKGNLYGTLNNLYVEDSHNMMAMMDMMGDSRNMMAMMNVMDMNKFNLYGEDNRNTMAMINMMDMNKGNLYGEDSHKKMVKDKGLVDVIKRFEKLSITDVMTSHVRKRTKKKCNQVVLFDQNSLISTKGIKKPKPQVFKDENIYAIQKKMEERAEGSTKSSEDDYWKYQRHLFSLRVEEFRMATHLFQGDRRFSPWKGSVLDSVVGVFITQNTSDNLSSKAIMKMVSRFPKYPNPIQCNEVNICSEESVVESDEINLCSQESYVESDEINICSQESERFEDSLQSEAFGIQQSMDDCDALFSSQVIQDHYQTERTEIKVVSTSRESSSNPSTFNFEELMENAKVDVILEGQHAERNVGATSSNSKGEEIGLEKSNREEVAQERLGYELIENNDGKKNGKQTNNEKKKREPKEKPIDPINWDDLRKDYGSIRSWDNDDFIDWEAVRQTKVEEVADILQGRGMHNILAGKIKNLLQRVVDDHGSLNLEWLRNVPPEKTKEYLLSYYGLGLKSVECIRLLTLHHRAFPVDINVARIVVRLGWVPLDILPDGLELHTLEEYPLMDAVQQFLWPRLEALDGETLYELHYQMITFGKVFCTKLKPKCNVCPMSRSCKHYASLNGTRASATPSSAISLFTNLEEEVIREEGKGDKNTANHDFTGIRNIVSSFLPPLKPQICESDVKMSASQICEPIAETLASPIPMFGMPTFPMVEMPIPEIDIEDLCWESKSKSDEMLSPDLTGSISRLEEECAPSKALILPSKHADPTPKLMRERRLHTEHQVYVLPPNHELLTGFRELEPGDLGNYLLAIWIKTGEGTNSDQQDEETISGTVLIPCRTANDGYFPLNGTYFHVNEVFADHETSLNPIRVPRKLLWNLERRSLYCAKTGTSIFRDMNLPEIQDCFWKGYLCVRGFDRITRNPETLHERFYTSNKPKPKTGVQSSNGSDSKEAKDEKKPKKAMSEKTEEVKRAKSRKQHQVNPTHPVNNS